MPRHSAYNPDYESLYSGIEITPDVLHVLRTSDRKMRYMEHQLKTERFVEDQEQRVAKFLPSRETSLDEMIEKEHRQFAAEQPSWEDELLHQELICRLHSAIKLLEQSERELILAIYFEGLTERQLARRADLHHMTILRPSPGLVIPATWRKSSRGWKPSWRSPPRRATPACSAWTTPASR